MPIKVEAAVVTQKHPSAAFNTDSININGKVLPRETVKNGYKGSGIIGGNSYFVLTSSDVEGFADAAVTAFNNRAEIFGVSRDARSVFSGFFEDCRSALLNMSREEKELSSVCLYARGRKAVLAANYENGLFLFRNGECLSVETKPAEDTVANYSNAVLPDLTEGDIFLLLSPDAAKLLTQKDVADICKISDGSVKKIVSLISKVVLAKDGCKAVGAFAIKILETAVENDDSLGFASVFASPDGGKEAETATEIDVNEEAENDEINENTAENGEDVTSSEAPAIAISEENDSPDTDTAVAEAVEAAQNEEAENANINVNAEFSEKIQSEQGEVEDVESPSDDENGENEAEHDVDEENADENTEESENGEKPSGEKRTKLFIALFSLVALSVFLFVVIFFVRGFSGDSDKEANATEGETTTEMSESESESESTSQDEEETASESTTAQEASSETTTVKREDTTTERTNNSVSYNEKTTKAETQTEPETTAEAEETSSEEEASATEAETEESTSEKTEETTSETAETEEENESSVQEEIPSENEKEPEENSEEPTTENNVENSSEENA